MSCTENGSTYIKGMFISRFPPIFYACDRADEQLLRMRLQMEEVVCGEACEEFLESFGIGFVQEKLLPETFGFLNLFFLLHR